MKFATYVFQGTESFGVVVNDRIVDIKQLLAGVAPNLLSLLPVLDDHKAEIKSFVSHDRYLGIPLQEVTLLAPIGQPRKFLGIGANFESHLKEIERFGMTRPTNQIWFNKQVSCVNSPYGDVVLPAVSEQLDYEGELAIVIGKKCRRVSREEAKGVIGGYTICNDFSVRDWQRRAPTHTLGKSFDTHGPIGPYIVTPDEIGNPNALRIRTWVNGELRQDGNTDEFAYDVYDMIAELSAVFSLEPGDILATGTPAGVGLAMSPPQFLKVGDRVRVEIEKIGFIENRIIADSV